MNIFHNPFKSSLRFSRAPDYLAVIFVVPLCINFDDIPSSDGSCFLRVNEGKMTYIEMLSRAKRGRAPGDFMKNIIL